MEKQIRQRKKTKTLSLKRARELFDAEEKLKSVLKKLDEMRIYYQSPEVMSEKYVGALKAVIEIQDFIKGK